MQRRETQELQGDATAEPPWLQATLDDIRDFDFEGPIKDVDAATCDALSTAYHEAAKLHEKLDDPAAAPACRVFQMLAAVTSFHFKPQDRREPFGARAVMEEGRTPIPDDFRGRPVETLSEAADRATNPVLKARLCDVCWLLERKRHALGRAAIAAYLAIVEGLASGLLKDRLEWDDPGLGLASRDALQRSLMIGRVFEPEAAEVERAKEWLISARERAIAGGEPATVHSYFDIDLNFGVSDPSVLAHEIEDFVDRHGEPSGSHTLIDLMRLAAQAYHLAKEDEGKNRCHVAAAELLVAEAERHSSPMLAAHWMSDAIAEYHGIPGARERRTELRHKLIDIQAGVPDEMSIFEQQIDLREVVDEVQAKLERKPELIDKLLLFANLTHSPQPDKLVADAMQSIRAFPLLSLLGKSFHDNEGKVIHRTEGGGLNDDGYGDAIHSQIAQHERLRREIHVAGQVRVARQSIVDCFYLGEDTLHHLLRHSPFVPHRLIGTYSRGLVRFFQGDYTSALYILTPMLEASLRHVLKMAGHDVTNFDDARRTQQDRTISALLSDMRPELEEIFGKAAIADIDHVFLSRPGPSIRNDVAHGLLSDGDPYGSDAIYACWLIFRLCCVPLFPSRTSMRLPA